MPEAPNRIAGSIIVEAPWPSDDLDNDAVSAPKMSQDKIIQRLVTRALKHLEDGNIADCERYAEGALRFAQRSGEDPHPLAITVRLLLATAALKTGRFTDACAHCDQAIQDSVSLYGENHLEVISGLRLKAHIMKGSGELDESIALLEDALERCSQVDGGHAPEEDIRKHLGIFYRDNGKLDQSWRHHEVALAKAREAHGEGSLPVAYLLEQMGITAQLLGRTAEARQLSDSASMIMMAALPPNHIDIARNQNLRGMIAIDERDHSRALSLLNSALKISQQQQQPDKILIGALLNNIALIHEQRGDTTQAAQLYAQSLNASASSTTRDEPRSAVTMSNLAVLAMDQGNLEGAVSCQQEALELMRGQYDRHHPNFLTVLSNLTLYQAVSGDIEAALANHREVIEISLEQAQSLLSLGTQDQKQAYIRTVAKQVRFATALHLQFAPDRPDVAQMAFEATLQLKGRAMDAHAALIEKLRLSSSDDGNHELLSALSEAHADYAAKVYSGESDPEILRQHQQALDALEIRLNTRAADRLESLQHVPTLDRIAALLPE